MIRKLLERIKSFWKTYVIRDEFFLAREQFKKDNAEQGLRYVYPLNGDSVVVDFGGYKGEWAKEIWDRYTPNIFIFEPLKDLFDEAVKKFQGNAKVKLYNFGLSDKDEKVMISLEGLASSVFQGKKETEVELKDVKEVFEELNLNKIDLLKINIEGGEFVVLPRMIESGLVDRCNDLQIQFHHFYPNSEKLRDKIKSRLLKTHKLTYDYPFFFENYHRILRDPANSGDRKI